MVMSVPEKPAELVGVPFGVADETSPQLLVSGYSEVVVSPTSTVVLAKGALHSVGEPGIGGRPPFDVGRILPDNVED